MDIKKTIADFININTDISSCILLVQDSSNHISYKMPITMLMTQLMNEYVQSTNNLKGMAFENKEDYAIVNHDHDIYTNVDFCPSELSNPLEIIHINDSTHLKNDSISVLQFDNSSLKDIITPLIFEAQPKLGTIEFKSTYDCPLTSSSNFMGWVPLDGHQYSLTSFLLSNDLKHVFSYIDSGTTKTFTVPSMKEFMKFKMSLDSTCEHHLCKYNVASHSHSTNELQNPSMTMTIADDDFNLVSTGTKDLTLQAYYNCASHGNYGIHHGIGNGAGWIDTKFSNVLDPSTFVNAAIRTKNDGISTAQFKPSHNMFQAYVYIGRSIYSAPLYRDENEF